MVRVIILAAWVLALSGAVMADEVDSTQTSDSTAIVLPPPGFSADSSATPLAADIDDSIRLVFPKIDPDTLNENQRMLVEFETRLALKRRDQALAAKPVTRFAYFDSLVHYMVTPRWNLRDDVDRAFFHDPGDYFRFNPAYFRLEPQVTPLRKTIQPYGLSGNRFGLLIGGQSYAPFEHMIEPDGAYDLNDAPTALDSTVAILPGPVGMLMGAQHSAAGLLTLPSRYGDHNPHTSMIVDKGAFGYSYARGRYSKAFTSGKQLDFSIGYRITDGSNSLQDDDAYYYTGDIILPLSPSWVLRTRGRLYDRTGHYQWRPLADGRRSERNRIDRSAEVSLQHLNAGQAMRYEFGYRYRRQGSSLTGPYDANLNCFGQGLFAAREWWRGRTAVRFSIEGEWSKFDDWWSFHERYSGAAGLEIARLTEPWRMALRLRHESTGGFNSLPMAIGLIARESEGWYLMLSAGYSERAPSLYELKLRRTEANIYGTGIDYADHGNSDLVKERQLIGSVELQLGSATTNLTANVTGGRIRDGIDWWNHPEDGLTVFSPINGDVDFVTGTLTTRVSLWDFFHLLGGGSYHVYDYAQFPNKPYSPEYQGFAGGELHWYWRSRLIHFYAYGEVEYVGPFDGYVESDLGNQPVINGKLSLGLRKFRFHWVFQNIFLQNVRNRDFFTETSRFTYFGFTWDFMD